MRYYWYYIRTNGVSEHILICNAASRASFTRMSFRWWNATLAARPEIPLFNPVNAAWDCRSIFLHILQFLKTYFSARSYHSCRSCHTWVGFPWCSRSDDWSTGRALVTRSGGKWFVFVLQALEIARTCRDMLGGPHGTATCASSQQVSKGGSA